MFATTGEIIDALGGTGEVATALGLSASTVSSWRPRGIPSHWWRDIVAMASERGSSAITLELLADLDAKAARSDSAEVRP